MSRPDPLGRDDDDAAAVLAVVIALTRAVPEPPKTAGPLSVWGDPGHRLPGRPAPSAAAWWASGLTR